MLPQFKLLSIEKKKSAMKVKISKPLLRITRGKTKFPFRAIESDRFLIGAGSCCQLQLSAGNIPMVYAIVHQVQGGYQIEALHSEPAMLVNGTKQQFAILQPGDKLNLGAYEFEFLIDQVEHVLRATPEEVQEVAQQPTHSKPQSLIPPVPEKIDELTALQLVSRIERELELIDQLELEDEQQSKETRKIA